MVHNSPYERYYHDVSREQAQPAIDMLQAMASSTFETPTVYAGWRDYGIPCTYIKCLQDVALPSELCNMYIARLREGGVDVSVEELDTSHSPFWTAPEKLAGLLERVTQ